VTPIAVLIADDSVVVRRVMTNVLSADPDIRVVGTAGSGRTALEKIEELKPEILILDIEMPRWTAWRPYGTCAGCTRACR
jgi:two-component system, chemotaxis family, protein-glutamate methylesterase/glutaminase